jgi:hypothetical protein
MESGKRTGAHTPLHDHDILALPDIEDWHTCD